MERKSGQNRNVSDNNIRKSSMRESSNRKNSDLSNSIQIEKEKKTYLNALRTIYVENAADDYLDRKLVHDLLKTQCRDSDLFQAPKCEIL
jgi:hypothetical protein